MAITNNNVKNVKFLRNGELYNNHDTARAALENFTLTAEQDGTLILARYGSGNDVKTLAGLVYAGTNYQTITILDIDSEAADIDALRQEINAKLGTGVTSANTATAQLAALSGNTASTSAETSVEGAKRYADALISELDYTDTAVNGEYVSQVSEADGVISVTRVALPTVSEISESGKPIVAIKEDKGTISAATGTINAEYVNVADTAEKFTATTVEGVLAELKGDLDSTIDGLDYTGVTTGDGVVITNVTENNGVVAASSANVGGLKLTGYSKGSDSGTVASTDTINQAVAKLENQIDAEKDARAAAIDALDYTDTAVTKQFVAAVDESNGVISVTRGELQSSGKTIVISADGNNVNFEANIDGVTLEKDENGVISVTSSALVQYEGDDDTIQIGAVSDGKRIVSSPLTIQKVTTGLSEEVKEEYHLIGHSGTTIGDPVKIYKDSHIVSINYITGGTHAQNLEYVYIDASGNTQTTYVDMSELVLEAEFASGVTITDHVAHGVVDPTSETFLTVGEGGFKLSGVQDAINSAVNGLDADVSGNSTHVTVGVQEVDGKITAVTVSESNVANADDLAGLSGKTITEVESSNSSISAETAATTDGTVKVDLTTDASKIKMTGFTSDASGFTAVTTASTVTEAVKAIETAFIDNEEVVSETLNDLNSRLETVSGDVDTIKPIYLSGVSVNGSATTVSDHVAGFNVTAATGATTTNGTNAITVDTDANGNITLGISVLDCGVY